MAGTPDYLAPEMLCKLGYNESLDCWCLGVLVYEMIVHATPFYEPIVKDTYKRIICLNYKYPDHPKVDSKARDLIKMLLVLEPPRRLTSAQVLKHDWIVKREPSALLSKPQTVTEYIH